MSHLFNVRQSLHWKLLFSLLLRLITNTNTYDLRKDRFNKNAITYELIKRQKRMILSELLTEVVPLKILDRSLPSSAIFLSLEIFNTWSLCWMYRIIKCLNFLLLCKHIQTSTRANESFCVHRILFPYKGWFFVSW